MRQAIREYRGSSQQQPNGLVARELEALRLAAGFALLLDGVAFEISAHKYRSLLLASGSIAKPVFSPSELAWCARLVVS